MIRERLRIISLHEGVRWALFLGAVGLYGLLLLAEASNKRLAGLGLSEFWAVMFVFGGLAVAMDGRDQAMTAVFSFVLPGYRESLRRSVFSSAVRWGVALSLFLFSDIWRRLNAVAGWPTDLPLPESMLPGPGVLEIALDIIGGFFGGMAICLLETDGSLIPFKRRWLAVPVIMLPIVVGPIAIFLVVSQHPFTVWPILIPACILICGFFWFRLGDPDWVHRGHRVLITLVMERDRPIGFRTVASSAAEDSFQSLLQCRASKVACQYLRGGLFRAFGLIVLYWREVLVLMTVAVVVLGYAGKLITDVTFIALGVVSLWPFEMWAASDILLPEGRRQKRSMVAVMTAGTSLLLLAVAAVTVAASWLFGLLLPDFALGEIRFTYAPINPSSIYLSCLLVPWAYAHRLLHSRVPVAANVSGIAFVAPLVIGTLLAHQDKSLGWPWLAGSLPTLFGAVLVCGWATFLLTLSIASTQDFAALHARTPD